MSLNLIISSMRLWCNGSTGVLQASSTDSSSVDRSKWLFPISEKPQSELAKMATYGITKRNKVIRCDAPQRNGSAADFDSASCAGSIPAGVAMLLQLSWWQRLTVNQEAVGSSPTRSAIQAVRIMVSMSDSDSEDIGSNPMRPAKI